MSTNQKILSNSSENGDVNLITLVIKIHKMSLNTKFYQIGDLWNILKTAWWNICTFFNLSCFSFGFSMNSLICAEKCKWLNLAGRNFDTISDSFEIINICEKKVIAVVFRFYQFLCLNCNFNLPNKVPFLRAKSNLLHKSPGSNTITTQ